MSNATAPNWADMGIEWDTSTTVGKRAGPNNSDKRTVRTAQIPVIVDLTKFRETFGDEFILSQSNGTSLRVQAQGINRDHPDWTDEAIRKAIIARIQGTRFSGATVTKEVAVYFLPDGSKFEGTEWTEYQQAYAAQLVDLGTPGDVARTIALALQK